ncbi:unnamed protein product, partial [Didymodactylos carnosus]
EQFYSPLTDMRLFAVDIQSIRYTDDKCYYEGQYQNGKRHGEGRCLFRCSLEKVEWTGQWHNDMWHVGKLEWKRSWNVSYTSVGRWTGNQTGGTYTDEDMELYQGDWMAGGIAHGFGCLTYTNGTRYIGNFLCGRCHGQ